MDLDQLKAYLQKYDQQLLSTQQLSQHTLRRIIRQDSQGTLARIRRRLRLIAMAASAMLLFTGATLVGNPFDFTHWVAYAPLALYGGLAALALGMSARTYVTIQHIDLTTADLRQSLLVLLAAQQRMNLLMDRIRLLCLLAGLGVCFSLIIRQLDNYGPLRIALMLLGLLSITGLVYVVVTRYFGAPADPYAAQLQQHIRELDELNEP